MRSILAMAALALAGMPASAQQSGSQSQQGRAQSAWSSTVRGQVILDTSAVASIRALLEKAGFKDVKVVDSAFLVNAQTSDGGNARMYIDPSPDGRPSNQDRGSGIDSGSKSNK